MARKARKRRGSTFTVEQIREMLEEKVQSLTTYRAEILAELATVDEALAVAGAGVSEPSRQPTNRNGAARRTAGPRRPKKKSGRGRRSNGQSLPAFIERALTTAGKPMTVSEIADAVRKAGYESSSARFATIVTQRLTKMEKVTRVSRGVYALQ